MVCTACGAPVSEAARFCAGCGRALHAVDDERRVVTVLFADLVGFTTLSERLDPERVKNLVDRCFDRLAAEVVAFGGQVDKIVGDAMVALFGAPVAHEDDAERAVRAALRMQEVIGDGLDEAGEELQIRIGVNTGEVLVGAMRAAGTVTAMGDVVNTASRLQTSARPGEVLVGPATHAATHQAIAYESVGLLEAKGREEPIETWQALAPISAPGFRSRRLDVPLLGRDHEIGLLRHAVGSSIANQRALLVLLMGDVGMGKSRLADEAGAWAEAVCGANVREGRCLPYGEANIWWPVAEALREGFAMPGDLDRAATRAFISPKVAVALEGQSIDVERVVEGLLTLLGHEATSTAEPATVRDNAARALSDYLGALTRKQPLLVKVSDLHWADDAVLDLIDEVATTLHHRPLVVVATARPNMLDHWVPRPGRHNSMVLHLDPLDRAASAELLEYLVGAPVPQEVVDEILTRSGGNPFFLEELVPLLDASEAWHGADQVAKLPDTLRGLVAARLDDLDPSVRSVLQNASVIGHHGPVAGLREMGAQMRRGIDIDDALERLVADEIMQVVDDSWSFRSDLVREVAYQTITKAERARCHLGIAHYLERVVATRRPRPVSVVDQIAHHYGAAVTLTADLGARDGSSGIPSDLADRARRWVVEAAERARRDQAMLTAVRLYSEAIELLASGTGAEPAEVAELHIGRSAVAAASWDLALARRDIEQAQRLVGDDHPELQARLLVVRGTVEQREGDVDAAVVTLSDAIARFAGLGDDTGRADALRQLGMVEIFAGRTIEAEAAASAALEVFGRLGDRAGEAWANQNLAWIAFVSGRGHEADAFVEAAGTAFTELHDVRGLAWTNGLLSWLRFQQGRVEEAERVGRSVLVDARSHNEPWAVAMMTLLLASIRLWSGDVDEAVELASEGLRNFETIGDPYGTGQGAAVLGRALVMAGRLEEGFDLLARNGALAEPGGGGGPADGQLARLNYVAAALQIGEPARAMALPGLADDAADTGTSELTVIRGLLALQCGEVGEAALLLHPASGPSVDPNLLSAQALCAAASGDGDAAALAAAIVDKPGSTYLDRSMAQLAAALQASRRGDDEAAQRRIGLAADLVRVTSDRTAPVVVAVVAAGIAAHVERADADELAGSADALARRLGTDPVGWRRIVALALATSAEPATV